MLSLVLKEISRIGNTLKVKYREIPVKSAWNTLFTREILCLTVKLVGGGMTMQLYQTFLLEVKNIRTCAVFAFHRTATIPSGWNIAFVGSTSHFWKYQVKLRHLANTKLNFDVGRTGFLFPETSAPGPPENYLNNITPVCRSVRKYVYVLCQSATGRATSSMGEKAVQTRCDILLLLDRGREFAGCLGIHMVHVQNWILDALQLFTRGHAPWTLSSQSMQESDHQHNLRR